MPLRGWLSLLCGAGRREWGWRQAGSTGDFEGVDIRRMIIRLLQREEIPLIWQIDRREIVENIYYLDQGELLLKPDYFDVEDWPPGEAEHYTPILLDCYDRGGTFWGAFEDDVLVGVAI